MHFVIIMVDNLQYQIQQINVLRLLMKAFCICMSMVQFISVVEMPYILHFPFWNVRLNLKNYPMIAVF